MTEHDPAVMKVEEWADYWHSAGAQIVFVSVTCILAFYPQPIVWASGSRLVVARWRDGRLH